MKPVLAAKLFAWALWFIGIALSVGPGMNLVLAQERNQPATSGTSDDRDCVVGERIGAELAVADWVVKHLLPVA